MVAEDDGAVNMDTGDDDVEAKSVLSGWVAQKVSQFTTMAYKIANILWDAGAQEGECIFFVVVCACVSYVVWQLLPKDQRFRHPRQNHPESG